MNYLILTVDFVRFFGRASAGGHRWSNFRFIRLAPYPLYYFLSFPLLNTCVAHKILSSLWDLSCNEPGARISECLWRWEKVVFFKFKGHLSHWSFTRGIILFYHYAWTKIILRNVFRNFLLWMKYLLFWLNFFYFQLLQALVSLFSFFKTGIF